MPFRLGHQPSKVGQEEDGIQAFCRHLGELCDALTAPYDAANICRAACAGELQATTCNLMLQNALYQWLGERVEVSLSSAASPEEAAKQAREAALASVETEDLLSGFVDKVVAACAGFDPSAQPAPEPAGRSLLFDLPGHLQLLGPEEVDGLLADLGSSDAPLSALEALSADPHLLEDLCFGPTWPQLCGALGRLAGLAQQQQQQHHPQQQPDGRHLNSHGSGGHGSLVDADAPGGAAAAPPPLSRLSELLLSVLGEAVSAVVPSSPAHAADLLAELAPRLCGAGRTARGSGAAGGGGGGGTALRVGLAETTGSGTARDLLAAAVTADPFAAALARLAHGLLGGLAAEFHTLPPRAADRAAAAVVQLVCGGLVGGVGAGRGYGNDVGGDVSGQPRAPSVGSWVGQAGSEGKGAHLGSAGAATPAVIELSALDLFVLMDPELRWWQRLCAATHATQRLAEAAAGAKLAETLEAAWGSMAAAAAAGAAPPPQPTHLVACTALLAGLVRGNNVDLLGCEVTGDAGGVGGDGDRRSGGGGGGGELLYSAAVALQQQPEARQHNLRRLQRMLGHLATCFCAAAAPRRPPQQQRQPSGGDGGGDSSAGGGGGRGSVFLHLAAEVLAAAAGHGYLPEHDRDVSGADGAVLAPILNAVVQADAAVKGATYDASTAQSASVWLEAAARVLDATAAAARQPAHASGSAITPTAGGNVTPDAWTTSAQSAPACMAAVLRIVVGHVKAPEAVPIPAWTCSAVRLATRLAAAGSAVVAAALTVLYDAMDESLRAYGGNRVQTPSAPELVQLSGLELLAAEEVLPYCEAASGDIGCCYLSPAGTGVAVAAKATATLPLPAGLRRRALLGCAARLLCATYDGIGAVAGGHGDGGAEPGGGAARGFGGEACVRMAAKRRVAAVAGALARSCDEGRAALLSAGFARRVLSDVTAVLRSGEYESPSAEPLPYADPLAGMTCVLAGVLCWPGLLSMLGSQQPQRKSMAAAAASGEPRTAPGLADTRVGGGGGGVGDASGAADTDEEADAQEHIDAFALVQELVAWLDPTCCRGPRGLPHEDAAAVSLACLAAAVEADPRVAPAALAAHTDVRRHLMRRLAADGEAAEEGTCGDAVDCRCQGHDAGLGAFNGDGPGAASDPSRAGPGGAAEAPQGRVWGLGPLYGHAGHSDLLLDRARDLLRALDGEAD